MLNEEQPVEQSWCQGSECLSVAVTPVPAVGTPCFTDTAPLTVMQLTETERHEFDKSIGDVP